MKGKHYAPRNLAEYYRQKVRAKVADFRVARAAGFTTNNDQLRGLWQVYRAFMSI